MQKKTYSLEEVTLAVKQNLSIAGVLRHLHLRPSGGNYKTIHSLILKHGLDTSHFTGKGWNVGLKFKPTKKSGLSDILVQNSSFKSIYKLKKRLLEEGVKLPMCECCKQTRWMGQPIPLELHHINGVNTDHRLKNLQLLCPNCHALTDNYRGKQKLSALSEKREVERRKFKETLTGNADGNLEPSLEK